MLIASTTATDPSSPTPVMMWPVSSARRPVTPMRTRTRRDELVPAATTVQTLPRDRRSAHPRILGGQVPYPAVLPPGEAKLIGLSRTIRQLPSGWQRDT